MTATTTLDHFAFIIDLGEYEAERRRLQDLGVPVRTKTFPYFQWRSLFFSDPEGNTVEFVAYDPNMEGDEYDRRSAVSPSNTAVEQTGFAGCSRPIPLGAREPVLTLESLCSTSLTRYGFPL